MCWPITQPTIGSNFPFARVLHYLNTNYKNKYKCRIDSINLIHFWITDCFITNILELNILKL